MTPQEKDLIQNVFDRLTRSGVGQKDAEAEALIREQVQRVPDAAYGLVQAVIVQEMGLNQATARINELQRQLDEARTHAPAASGGFLGGASPWGAGSVPRSGGSVVSQQQPAYAPPPQQAFAPPPPQAAGGPWAQQPSAAGGFLRNAATMAAGVAGGTLIAEGLSSLFGGHRGGGFGGGFAGGSPWGGNGGMPMEENVTVNNYYGDQGRTDNAADNGSDRGFQDASYDTDSYDNSDGGLDGGFDDTSDA